MPSNDPDLFEHAFQHASVGMALVAIDGRWLKVNDALCRLVGYPRQELLTTSFQALTHPDDLEGDLSQVRRLVEAEIESYELEKRYVRKDGSYVWSLLSVSMVRDADERPRFLLPRSRTSLGASVPSPTSSAFSGYPRTCSPSWAALASWTS
jgi:PAS domain S-box-containing protein